VLWSVLFFGLKSPLYALIEIFMLWAAILAAIIVSYNVSKTASYLMVPYILWVSFAIMLNLMIYRMNA
ncbi:MAG: tryptophan-rich sensory protein, partial [Nanoarchaeota archaeon]|nr:tryptophan-rich sensory protein [Nanoarchaeota archaeon]